MRLASTEDLGRNKSFNVSGDSAFNMSIKIDPGKTFQTHGSMMMTANNLLSTKVNHQKKLNTTMGSDHVRSGELLPDTAALLQKRSVSNTTKNLLGEKIRENKIYTTRDD